MLTGATQWCIPPNRLHQLPAYRSQNIAAKLTVTLSHNECYRGAWWFPNIKSRTTLKQFSSTLNLSKLFSSREEAETFVGTAK